jgi:uncharacterized protein
VGSVKVRVVPRSGRRAASAGDAGIVVRVRAAPEGGKATEEAIRALADALDLPKGAIRLLTGARSRTKVMEVEGLTESEVLARLREPRS